MIYKAVYKCRLCGEIYENGCATENKKIAETASIRASIGKSEVNGPGLTEVHWCENDEYGISDFLGFKLEDE